jgi:hypothetical protein
MGLFDKVDLHAIGAKVGLTPEKMKAIGDTIQTQLNNGAQHMQALEASAAQHGVTVAKIEEAMGHAADQATTQINGAADTLFRKPT